ncbi:helix-turn-helix domain-containing protein [Citrobacter braakii]|jgi:DNA-binding CsgD family transcriptional regulator|uniref:helix-turn-helix domain-containing protein n=1 Tax=Citrobacter braakii TaxID=57706 RepID=UPI0010407C91|nr:helix-turn-helix transcriptional regulator [Citrobacter braakii]TCC79130.1 LuxR family transcriptional regulator [Citrobacter braakii]
MLMCGSDNFVGNGLFAYLTSKHVPIQTFQFEDMLHQSSLCQHQIMVFNIIDNEQPCSAIVQFLNKNRFKFYNNVVVIIADSLVAKLCVELLYVEKTIVLTEKSSLRDFGQLASLTAGKWNPRLYRSQKRLTEREQQILNLLVNGYTAREISELVSLNYKTIQAHKMRVVTKLGLTNTSELNKLIVRFTHRMSFLP